ncbi:hypothetical protein [Arenibacterium halophilum]|jgi:ATP:corrinoid adenosyltransferase|nr:hypothetical protein [Arenibacterium halophilum]
MTVGILSIFAEKKQGESRLLFGANTRAAGTGRKAGFTPLANGTTP